MAVGKLNARASASADEARKRAIARDLALTPRERVLKALSLGSSQGRAVTEGESTLHLAERLVGKLEAYGLKPLLIGAAANVSALGCPLPGESMRISGVVTALRSFSNGRSGMRRQGPDAVRSLDANEHRSTRS